MIDEQVREACSMRSSVPLPCSWSTSTAMTSTKQHCCRCTCSTSVGSPSRAGQGQGSPAGQGCSRHSSGALLQPPLLALRAAVASTAAAAGHPAAAAPALAAPTLAAQKLPGSGRRRYVAADTRSRTGIAAKSRVYRPCCCVRPTATDATLHCAREAARQRRSSADLKRWLLARAVGVTCIAIASAAEKPCHCRAWVARPRPAGQ